MENITQQEYQARINHGLALVEFFAPWCEPCLLLGNILRDLENAYPDFRFYEINCDENPDMVKEQKIRSIPTVFIYRDGVLLKEINGLQTKEAIERILVLYGEKTPKT